MVSGPGTKSSSFNYSRNFLGELGGGGGECVREFVCVSDCMCVFVREFLCVYVRVIVSA